MSAMHSNYAFCVSTLPLQQPFTALATYSVTSFRPTSSHFVAIKPFNFRPLPLRTPVHTRVSPRCAFGDNRNGEYKASDILFAAGRFLQSPSGQLVLWGLLFWLIFTGRIGIIFDSFLILFGVMTIVPVLAILGFRWWINRQLVQGTCPSCGTSVTGLRGQAFKCTVCGRPVQGENTGNFSVKDPSSATIDIDAKEIN